MWKKTVLALLIASPLAFAVSHTEKKPRTKMYNEAEVAQLLETKLKDEGKAEQQKRAERATQREYFIQAESILRNATATGKLSDAALQLSTKLIGLLGNYPLVMEAEWELLKAKLATQQATEIEIAAFMQKYPDSPYQKRLNQLPFEQLYSQQKFAELLAYAKKTEPEGNENQCRVFSAQYQLLAAQAQIDPEAEQASGEKAAAQTTASMKDLIEQFDKFWLQTAELPQMCGDIESYWRDQGGKSDEKVRWKAVELFKQNAKKGLENLIANNQNPDLAQWLPEVSKLLSDTRYLQTFVQNQPLNPINKALVTAAFPAFVKTLAEDMPNPDFAPYQAWATKWQLTPETLREWEITFIGREFDNEDESFKTWRDNELAKIKHDGLTERRLRMALWKQEDLVPWLALLSKEGQEKTEWRYWAAKNEKEAAKRTQQLERLADERGFYPMLAAQQLGKSYHFSQPEAAPLTDAQKTQFQTQLERIEELRVLNRFETAKSAWAAWLKKLSFEEQLALSEYALQQDWYDLAVEGTIQAKAWDYIDLRLPNAYTDWFDLNLTDKGISKTFAMAIARQESAWSPQAKSHANAMGLMQLLPSTATLTAQTAGLPFANEKDLFDPFKNIMLGTAHLNELNTQYPNNRILTAAAYNAGVNRVEKWLVRSNGKLSMDAFIASIPFYETRGYVQNVIAYDYYYQLLQNKTDKVLFYKEELERNY